MVSAGAQRHAVSARAVAASVEDPELPMLTLDDLGILRDVTEDGDRVIVTITPTYSGCPAMAAIREDLTNRLRDAGYEHVDVRTELNPPWTTDWITPDGRRKLAEHGIAPPGRAPTRVPLVIGARPASVACPRCGSPDSVEVSRFGATACKALRRCPSCGEPFEHIKEH